MQLSGLKPWLASARWALAAALLLAGGTIAVTFDAWKEMFSTAIHDTESTQILLVPIVVVWLAVIRRKELANCRRRGRWVGVILLAAGWALWSWGSRSGRHTPLDAGAILALIGAVAGALGSDVLLKFLPAFAAMFFMIPIWPVRRQQISGPLQLATAKCTQAACETLGIGVVRMGKQLFNNGVAIDVAEACSGMRLVLPLLLICYLYAFATPLRAWARIFVLAISPIVAVICNVIRLVPTVWVFGHAAPAAAQRFHDAGGWVMLGVAFLLMMWMVRLMRWLMLPVMQARSSRGVPAEEEELRSPAAGGFTKRRARFGQIAGTAICALLICGMGAERLTFLPAPDTEPYFARVREAAARLPQSVGLWMGHDVAVPYDVVGRLDPNVLICRHYVYAAENAGMKTNMRLGIAGGAAESVSLLVVHCRDARDLSGHYPPTCYGNEGFTKVSAEPRDWRVDDLNVHGMQYEFVRGTMPREAIAIENFIVMPDGRTERDISAVDAAADNVHARFYGAAEIQIVCDLTLSRKQRDEVARTFIRACRPLIETIEREKKAAAPVGRVRELQ